MTEKKYAFLELGGKNCPCRIPAVYHSAIVGYTCGKDKQDCNEQRCKNCPHGKTIDEMCKEIHYAICVPCTATANDACNKCPVHLGSIEDGLKALLGGEEGK